MEFSPAIDRRLALAVTRTNDLDSSADVWRGLRRRAAWFRVATPCYESVRRLVRLERERRARLAATIATVVEITTKRIPTLPEAVPHIYARHLARYRRRLRLRRPP